MLIIPRLQRVGQSPASLTIPLCASHGTGDKSATHSLIHPHSLCKHWTVFKHM